jgi:hypothetical protein
MRFKSFFLAAAMILGLSANHASAINIYVSANPYIGGYDEDVTTSGFVDYTVSHDAATAFSVTYFQLQFESSVFTSFDFVSSSINGSSGPALSEAGELLTGGGFTLGAGSTWVIRVAYTLADAATKLKWSESLPLGLPPWAQGYFGIGTVAGGFAGDGGSTELAPEPGTLMLLGSGLLSLGVVKRFRQKRKMSA